MYLPVSRGKRFTLKILSYITTAAVPAWNLKKMSGTKNLLIIIYYDVSKLNGLFMDISEYVILYNGNI